jgi:hypothetical protein
MALSAFFDKELPPTDRQVASILGATAPLWESTVTKITEQLPDVSTAWGFTSKATGWSLRVKLDERIIVYLTPTDGCFLASIGLGRRAVEAAQAAKLPKSMLAVIDAAPQYAEGRGVRFPVRNSNDVAVLLKLAVIKAQS